ncbi:hypothetical protein CHRY9390_00296 [Chryseobacterium aquaeductus]|uniref:DUF4190 domain-containing protein n=1 Tax=Chryseobacterium aquaeductus TaxID=2675056 RepID=A0A9N8MD85_9FLAO|nr:CCC motif membrane protein [Chryseobacterium aquaeductus]CAA7329656.1 hypothetical protein CHRY9390_00296 [Chryseobacterium potabilaquae]CAD7798192.1 hypothetical protein CHRY9390_00296 [Chryseobacterium aquaeductus]
MNQQNLPNATAVLVLGIVSIVGCCCYGIPGIIAGAIGLYLFNKDKALYLQNPDQYLNYNNLNTGRILSIIGISISLLYIITIVIFGFVFGWDALTDQELMQERLKDMQNQ